MSSTKQYLGRIVTVRAEEGFGFIGLSSVSMDDGAAHDLETTGDIFVHQDDCGSRLQVGMTVLFEVIADHRRRDGFLRARGATEEAVAEVMSDDDQVVGHLAALTTTGRADRTTALAHPIPPHPWQGRMKHVDAEVVAQVVENAPLADRPRDEAAVINPDDPRVTEALEVFLRNEFPHMAGLELGYDVVRVDETTFDAKAADALRDLRGMGMEDQATHVEAEIGRFKGTRTILNRMREWNLLRPSTFVPTRYFPDLFMACPVLYFAVGDDTRAAVSEQQETTDPLPHKKTRAICNLFPKNLRWSDTVQLFNRRLRPLTQYKGDIIPVQILRLIREAQQFFDHVVIATPYHDVAGREWQDPAWLRGIDPYVLGIQEGCSHFYVLGRFSDSGVFPLYHALVADTIAFLRANRERLAGFNLVQSAYWYLGTATNDCHVTRFARSEQRIALGTFLQQHVDAMLRAFDAGHLFDWLRGEWSEEQRLVDQPVPGTLSHVGP